jgi:hypothetical protein
MSVYNIIFQSNSIDGWFSAYLTAKTAATYKDDLVYFHPIDAKNPSTWPEPEKLAPAKKTSSMPERQTASNGKAFCFFIDCTITNAEYILDISKDFNIIVIDNNPAAAAIDEKSGILVKHNPKATTISLVWQHFEMAYASMPEWVQQIDRIESWSMEATDAAIRENLLEICRMPTMGLLVNALAKTEEYIASFTNKEKAAAFLHDGEEKLKAKISSFEPLLAATKSITLTDDSCAKYGFPAEWVGKTFLYVNTTGHAPDSSELASCAFARFGGDAFVNFRRRTHPGSAPLYVYSARASPSSDLSLIQPGSPFKGFEKSAGAIISSVERCVPFVSL